MRVLGPTANYQQGFLEGIHPYKVKTFDLVPHEAPEILY